MTRAARVDPPFHAPPDAPWVDSDALDQRLDAVAADEALRRFAHTLADTGVAVIDLDAAGAALCERVATDAEPHFVPGVARVQDLWRRSPAARSLALNPKVLRYLEVAYGRRPFPFQTLNFRVGSQQSAHADAIHFHSEPQRFMCGVWFALEDVQPGSGPLFYHPGSHKGPVLTMAEAGVGDRAPEMDDYKRFYEPALGKRLKDQPAQHAMLKKGQALVWAANLAHGGSPIEVEGSTRRSLVVHYFFEDCLYHTPMLSQPAKGRYQVRLPSNVRTGGWAWPRYKGRRVKVPRGVLATAILERLGRKVYRLS